MSIVEPKTTESASPPTPPSGPPSSLDLCFVLDCTGSMGSYIASAQANIKGIIEHIQASEKSDVQFGLVEYRDHHAGEVFCTRVHAFTSNITQMRADINACSAAGGGDGPEAVAAGLYEALNMNWRKDATKICVLIADAPPHGLEPHGDSYPNGDPDGRDPLQICRDMAGRGIICYSVGCEPALGNYTFARDFMVSVAELTGGKAVALSSASLLAQVIMGSAAEELNLQLIMREVEEEVNQLAAAGLDVTDEAVMEGEVATRVHTKLQERQCKTKQMETPTISSAYADHFKKASSLAACKASLGTVAPPPPTYSSVPSACLSSRLEAPVSLSKRVALPPPAPSAPSFMSRIFGRRSSKTEDTSVDAKDEHEEVVDSFHARCDEGDMMMESECMPSPSFSGYVSSAPAPPPEAFSYAVEEKEISKEQVSRMLKRSYAQKKSHA